MKNIIAAFLMILLTVGLTPRLVMRDVSFEEDKVKPSMGETKLENNAELSEGRVVVLNNNKNRSMSLEDFLYGAAAAAMPIEYSSEAISALCLCILSYADYCKQNSLPVSCAVLERADLKERWAEDYSHNMAKLKAAADRVMSFRLCYENEPINALWHTISPGRTRAADSASGKDFPYLVSVSSDGDRLSPDFCEVRDFTYAELSEALGCEQSEPQFSFESSSEDFTQSIELFSEKYSAEDLCEYLNLRSPFFTVTEKDAGLQFRIFGCGDGRGLSCYGADYMARQGADFCEIVLHYFPDCIILAE